MPGGGEIFIILLIVLLLFGSKKIPELARGLGKGIRYFKDATSDVQNEIRESINDTSASPTPKEHISSQMNPGKDESEKDEPGKDEPEKDGPEKDEPKKDEPEKDEPEKDDEDQGNNSAAVLHSKVHKR